MLVVEPGALQALYLQLRQCLQACWKPGHPRLCSSQLREPLHLLMQKGCGVLLVLLEQAAPSSLLHSLLPLDAVQPIWMLAATLVSHFLPWPGQLHC
jgi:hypothetical protein